MLTNLSEDHLGIDGINTLENLLHVKSLVVESIKAYGYAVLNADDQWFYKPVIELDVNYILFKQEDNLISIGIYLLVVSRIHKNDYIIIATGSGNIQSLNISKVPATHGSKLIHNVELPCCNICCICHDGSHTHY